MPPKDCLARERQLSRDLDKWEPGDHQFYREMKARYEGTESSGCNPLGILATVFHRLFKTIDDNLHHSDWHN